MNRRGNTHKRMTAFTELKDRDHIRVVLRNPFEIIQPRSSAYGYRSYNFSVPQTVTGITKFFSILKFIVSTKVTVIKSTNYFSVFISTL